jgi:dihydroorotate dehydrogenase electron transfer subunit
MYLKERIIENRPVGHPSQGICKLVLSGQVAKLARPGQFLHIRVAEQHDPLLRRPLSIAGINEKKEEVTLFYKVLGKGTDLLSRCPENSYVSILGPLGNGFTIPTMGELVLIGGGIGIFPLYSLLQAVDPEQVALRLFWGGQNIDFLESAGLQGLLQTGVRLHLSTMDGSLGYKGLVTDLLAAYLAAARKEELPRKNLLEAAACGPRGMLQATAAICRKAQVPLEVSLEERMACGVGACLGCVCMVQGEDGKPRRKRVCKEGPVLRAEEVLWDAEA